MDISGGGGGCPSTWVDDGSVESLRLFLARRTVLEMLRDRGCAVDPDHLNLTLPAFRASFGDQPDLNRLRISSSLLSNPSKKVLVIFCGTEKLKLPAVNAILADVRRENLSRLILILQNTMTARSRAAMKEITAFKVEQFQITELLVNITKHILKPRHETLTEEEKKKLLKKYNVKDSQLPRMLQTDAIARYYGLDKGQVVKVTYEGELTGSHVTYRCVT